MTEEANTTTQTKPTKAKRTRKVGGLQAFHVQPDGALAQVVNGWPDGIKTKEAAKKAYVSLELTGKIILMRAAGTIEAKHETITRFV